MTDTTRKRLSRVEMQAQTRERLLEAAQRLFRKKGFLATSLEDIAEEAGYSKGAVYSNFKSKEDLFLFIVNKGEAGIPDTSMFEDETMSWAERFSLFGERAVADASTDRKPFALSFEAHAFAFRNERARRAVAKRMRDFFVAMGSQIDTQNRPGRRLRVSGLELVLMMQALFDGLSLLRAYLPDLAAEELYGKTFRLLAQLVAEDQVSPADFP